MSHNLVAAQFPGVPPESFNPRSSRRGTTEVVDRAMTLSTLTASANHLAAGTPITFKLDLSSSPAATGGPTGLVRLFVDGEAKGPLVTVDGGHATLGPVSLAAGSHQIRAAYRGNPNFTPVDGLLIETADRIPTPFGPDVTPGANGVTPLLCKRPLALQGIKTHGARLKLIGSARADYVGQRVAIRSRGRTLARTTVRAGGKFTTTVRRPHRTALRTTSYIATAGGARSNVVRAVQQLRIVKAHAVGPREVRLRARLSGVSVARIVLRRKVGCGPKSVQTIHPVKIRHRGRRNGPRTLVVKVPRPAEIQGPASYWLKASGKATKSLPVLVRPQPR